MINQVQRLLRDGLLFALLGVALMPPSFAGCWTSLKPLAMLAQETQVLLRAEILDTDEENLFDCGVVLHFGAKVLSILKTDGRPVPDALKLDTTERNWPTRVGFPFRTGQTVFLLLTRGKDDSLHLSTDEHTVLPAPGTAASPVGDLPIQQRLYDELKRVLRDYGPYSTAEEIETAKALANEARWTNGGYKDGSHGHNLMWQYWGKKDAASKAELLMLLSEIAPTTELGFIEEYLSAAEPELQEAARTAMLRLDPSPERVARIVKEMAVVPSGKSDIRPGYVLRLMHEMAVRLPGREEAGPISWTRACLPLYRLCSDRDPVDDYRQHEAVDVFTKVGTIEDAPRLSRLSHAGGNYTRLKALEALAAKLGVPRQCPPMTSMDVKVLPPDVAEWERNVRAAITPLLEQRGINDSTKEKVEHQD